jgi:ATP synthase protein I
MLQAARLTDEVIDRCRGGVVLSTGFVCNPPEEEVNVGEFRDLFRSAGLVSSMGLSVVIAIAIGVWFGLTLDRWWGTAPWFFYIFMFIGIAAGFRNIHLIASRELRKSRDDENG